MFIINTDIIFYTYILMHLKLPQKVFGYFSYTKKFFNVIALENNIYNFTKRKYKALNMFKMFLKDILKNILVVKHF